MSLLSHIIFTLLLVIFGHGSASQNSDGLVALKGKILDAKTKEPIQANIRYERLPQGNVTGIRNFEGNYQLLLQHHYAYRIEVCSPDYLPLEVTVTTALENTMKNDFYLQKTYKEGELIRLPDKILFDRGKADITPSSYELLRTLTAILNENPSMQIQLEGHTDAGDRKSLMALSEERVVSVKKCLAAQGIDKRRMKTKAFGGTRPLSNENTPEAHSLNRRVEIRITKL